MKVTTSTKVLNKGAIQADFYKMTIKLERLRYANTIQLSLTIYQQEVTVESMITN